MTDQGTGADARATTMWLGVAAGIIPVLFVLPPYIFPIFVPFLDVSIATYDGRRLIELENRILRWRPKSSSAAAS